MRKHVEFTGRQSGLERDPVCHVVFLTGERSGEAVEFRAGRITIGRASDCDIQFPPYGHPVVAAHHAEIICDGERFILYDTGSRSGTLVNGRRIEGAHRLRSEDYIRFGANGPEVLFRLGPIPEGGPQMPPPPIPMAELRVRSGADEGKVFLVRGDRPTRIGRRSDMEVQIDPAAHVEVSGHHCTIYYEDGRFVVVDTSRNGTFVNEKRVRGSAYLDDGAVLKLAPTGPRLLFTHLPPRRDYPNAGDTAEDLGESAERVQETGAIPVSLSPSLASSQTSEDKCQQLSFQVPSDFLPTDASSGSREGTTGPTPSPPGARRPRVRRQSRVAVRLLLLGVIAAIIASGALLIALRHAIVPSLGQARVPTTVDYLQQITDGSRLELPTANFRITLPKGWAKLESPNILSIESPDKVIAVDYVSDERLTPNAVEELLRAKGTIPRKVEESTYRGVRTLTYVGRGGSRTWIAVLHAYEKRPPMLALLEVDSDFFKIIPDKVLAALAFEKFEPMLVEDESHPGKGATTEQATEPRARSAVTLPPVTNIQGPEQGVAPPKEVRPPLSTSGSLPLAPRAPRAAEETTTPHRLAAAPQETIDSEQETSCPSARLRLHLPRGWSARVDHTNGILYAVAPSGIEIRITRDGGALDASAVFDEMEREGWKCYYRKVEGTEIPGTGRRHYAAAMAKGGRHALLSLIDQVDSSTLVVYTSLSKEILENQKRDFQEVIIRLAREN